MRFLLPALLTAAAVTAQSPLSTTFANNNGGAAGGAVYFTLAEVSGQGHIITDIDLNFGGAAGASGSIEIFEAPAGTTHTGAGWTSLGTSPVAATAGAGSPTPITLSAPIAVGPNSTTEYAIVAIGLAHAYTTATGLPVPYAATAEMEITAGSASNVPFAGGLFSPRLINTNINYVTGSGTLLATAEVDGAGCVETFASFYEEQAPGVFDLNNTQLDIIDTGAGLVVTGVNPSTINPVGSLDPAAVPLVLGDDVSTPAGSFGLEVFSNCQVAFGPGNDTFWTPDVATLLSNPSTALYAWTDLSPNLAGSGQVTYEEDAVAGLWQVTYDGVWAFGTTDPSTVQFRGDVNAGTFAIAFGTMHTAGPENILVGYSVGGASADPGASDISSVVGGAPILTAGADSAALTLAADERPIVQAAANPLQFTTSNISAGALFHLFAIGTTNPGFPLAFIGFDPACTQNADALVLLGPDVLTGAASFTFTGLTLPANPGIVGSVLHCQSYTLDLTLLSPSARASNGIKLTIGDF